MVRCGTSCSCPCLPKEWRVRNNTAFCKRSAAMKIRGMPPAGRFGRMKSLRCYARDFPVKQDFGNVLEKE